MIFSETWWKLIQNFVQKFYSLLRFYYLQDFWHKCSKGDKAVVLGIHFELLLKTDFSFAILWALENVSEGIDCITVLLAWLRMLQHHLTKVQRDHQYLRPWFHQHFLEFWMLWLNFCQSKLFLQIMFFCSSYSLNTKIMMVLVIL